MKKNFIAFAILILGVLSFQSVAYAELAPLEMPAAVISMDGDLDADLDFSMAGADTNKNYLDSKFYVHLEKYKPYFDNPEPLELKVVKIAKDAAMQNSNFEWRNC